MEKHILSIGYARVSQEQQAFEQALKMQVERLLSSGCDRVFADVGSRDKDDRQGLLEIIRLIEAGEVRSLSVTRLDRVTSSPGLFEKLTKLLRSHSVKLITLDESANIDSIDGEFSAGLQVYFSQRELKTIRLRIKKHYEHRRNKNAANIQAPWGYKVENGRYKLDITPCVCLLSDRPSQGEFPGRTYADLAHEFIETFFTVGMSAGKAVRTIHQRYGVLKSKHIKSEQGLMVFSQGDNLNYSRSRNSHAGAIQWSPDGFRRWLRNPVLRGHTPYKTRKPNAGNRLPHEDWDIRYNTHPEARILADDRYQAIEDAIALNKRIGGFAHKRDLNLFIGVLKCAVCGRNMRCQTVKAYGEKYYQCRSYAEERSCTHKKMIKESLVTAAVIERLIAKAHSLSEFVSSSDEVVEPPEIQQMRQQIEGLERLGHNPAIAAAKQEIQLQIDKWKYEQNFKGNIDANTRDLAIAFIDPNYWESLSKEQLKPIVRALVREVRALEGCVVAIDLLV